MKKLFTIILLTFIVFNFIQCSKSENNGSGKIEPGTIKQEQTIVLPPLEVEISGNRGFDSAAFKYNTQFNIAYQTPEKGNLVYVENGLYDFYVERYTGLDAKNSCLVEIKHFNPSKGINTAQIKAFVKNEYPLSDTLSTLYFQQEGTLNYYQDSTSKVLDNIKINSFNFNPKTRGLSFDLTIKSSEEFSLNSTHNPAVVTIKYSGIVNPANIVY